MNSKTIHQLDIHHNKWSKNMDKIMSGETKLSYMKTAQWGVKNGIYIPVNKSDEIIINEVGPRESKQAGGGFPVWQVRDIIRSMIRARIPAIEIAFAAGIDMQTIRTMVSEFGQEETRFGALTGFMPEAIKKGASTLEKAKNGSIHLFYPTQIDHIRALLDRDGHTAIVDLQNQVLGMVEHNIRIAADILPQVEFSPEIGIDTEPQFLLQVVRVAIKNGATILNIPDTRGGAMPDFIRKVFTFLHWGTQDLRSKYDFIFSCHNHNDMGMAAANTLAAVQGGATQAESTLKGIGEGVGNARTEEIIPLLRMNGYDLQGNPDYMRVARTADYVAGSVHHVLPSPFGPGSDADGAGVHKDRSIKYRRLCTKMGEYENPDFYRAGARHRTFIPDSQNVSIGLLGGKGQFVDALNRHDIRMKKDSPEIMPLQKYFCGDDEGSVGLTQEIKVSYDANVFTQYLRHEGRLLEESISFDDHKLNITFSLDGQKYCMTADMSDKKVGPRPAAINAIKSFLEEPSLELTDTTDSPVFTPAVAAEQFPEIHPIGDIDEHVENAPLWAEAVVSVGDKHKKSRVKGENTSETHVRAIFEACMDRIYAKKQH